MIIDTISQAHRYIPLHPDFGDAIHLLQTLDFAALPDGQIPCHHPNIRLFIGHEAMRTREAAQPEAHLKHIDIQVPLSGTESYGWIDRHDLQHGLGYDEQRDIEFFTDSAHTWLDVQVGEFVLFFPNDGHAPLVGEQPTIRKAVFKIRTLEYRLDDI